MLYRIAAVTVNHNTSLYTELMLRSLYAMHVVPENWSIIVFDNNSHDDSTGLYQFAKQKQILVEQSGFGTDTKNNSHGELLRRFVQETTDCTHYLFLDCDVCFIQPNTLFLMLEELEQNVAAFGIGPRMSWDGSAEIPAEVRQQNPDIQDARLHPCCALIRNTPLFRTIAQEIGFSAVNYLWAERDEYLDTFKLMTRVMATHGYHHIISATMIVHFFAVSYAWDTEEFRQWKAQQRDIRLQVLRTQ